MLRQRRGIKHLLKSDDGDVALQFLLFPLFSQFIVDFASAEGHPLYLSWVLARRALVWNQPLEFSACRYMICYLSLYTNIYDKSHFRDKVKLHLWRGHQNWTSHPGASAETLE